MRTGNPFLDFAEDVIARHSGSGAGYDAASMVYLENDAGQEPESPAAQQNFITNLYRIQDIKEENYLYIQNLSFLTGILEKRLYRKLYPDVKEQIEKTVREEIPKADHERIRDFTRQIFRLVQSRETEQITEVCSRMLSEQGKNGTNVQKGQDMLLWKLENIINSSIYAATPVRRKEKRSISPGNLGLFYEAGRKMSPEYAASVPLHYLETVMEEAARADVTVPVKEEAARAPVPAEAKAEEKKHREPETDNTKLRGEEALPERSEYQGAARDIRRIEVMEPGEAYLEYAASVPLTYLETPAEEEATSASAPAKEEAHSSASAKKEPEADHTKNRKEEALPGRSAEQSHPVGELPPAERKMSPAGSELPPAFSEISPEKEASGKEYQGAARDIRRIEVMEPTEAYREYAASVPLRYLETPTEKETTSASAPAKEEAAREAVAVRAEAEGKKDRESEADNTKLRGEEALPERSEYRGTARDIRRIEVMEPGEAYREYAASVPLRYLETPAEEEAARASASAKEEPEEDHIKNRKEETLQGRSAAQSYPVGELPPAEQKMSPAGSEMQLAVNEISPEEKVPGKEYQGVARDIRRIEVMEPGEAYREYAASVPLRYLETSAEEEARAAAPAEKEAAHASVSAEEEGVHASVPGKTETEEKKSREPEADSTKSRKEEVMPEKSGVQSRPVKEMPSGKEYRGVARDIRRIEVMEPGEAYREQAVFTPLHYLETPAEGGTFRTEGESANPAFAGQPVLGAHARSQAVKSVLRDIRRTKMPEIRKHVQGAGISIQWGYSAVPIVYSETERRTEESIQQTNVLQKQVEEVVRELKTVEQKTIIKSSQVVEQQRQVIKEVLESDGSLLHGENGRDYIRREVGQAVGAQMEESVSRIAGRVYRQLEERLKMERGRRGLL